MWGYDALCGQNEPTWYRLAKGKTANTLQNEWEYCHLMEVIKSWCQVPKESKVWRFSISGAGRKNDSHGFLRRHKDTWSLHGGSSVSTIKSDIHDLFHCLAGFWDQKNAGIKTQYWHGQHFWMMLLFNKALISCFRACTQLVLECAAIHKRT